MLKVRHKAGYTLIEVLVVVTIIGILSSMGVVSLQGAVANARIKDAAYNVSAFLERTANEARKVNTTLCVKKINEQKLVTFKSACSDANVGPKLDSLILESPVKLIVNTENNGLVGDNWAMNGKSAEFKPRPGLSAAPFEGFYEMQYGDRDLYGASAKVKTKNSFIPKVKYSGSQSSWTDI
jgi:prepilin-type N-terminal cleavage/methylation domain-containing protein